VLHAKNRNMELKDKFHFAKLSLFNMRLFNDFENNGQEEVKKIIERRANADNINLPINLLHQTSFLSHAYINFVWLWESIKQNNLENKILNIIRKKFDFSSKIKILEKGEERDLKDAEDFIRLIRNSISHGNIEVIEEFFIFYDENPRKRDRDYGKIRMKWETLGELSDIILFSLNDYLYIEK
jgi:hypothetical protein